ncbi:hypothetical protein M405DRAFT_809470 [Rhizopogon salebrosus TDB-379]|nr:hypothetical protein M405DRAFT_809470 [Rhizopogon salebrosus TDB-379]
MLFTFSVDIPPGSFPATSSSSCTFPGEGLTVTAHPPAPAATSTRIDTNATPTHSPTSPSP